MIKAIKRLYYFTYGYWIAQRYKRASKEQINTWQNKQLKKLTTFVTTKSPYYQQYHNKGFQDFPIINKKIFLKKFNGINTLELTLSQCEKHALNAENSRNFDDKIKGISVGLSSGTSAQRGVFLVSKTEQALWVGYILSKNLPFSFKKKKVALFLRSNSNLYESSNGWSIQFRFFDLTENFEKLLLDLERYQPQILIAPAHVLGVIVEHQGKIKPDKIISVAEVLEADIKQRVEQYFSRRVDEIYQATEGYIASTCSQGSLHINEDILIIEKEWLDENHNRFVPVITDLNRRTLPIIRYRLDDILIEDKTPCSCGSSFTRLKKIEGREDDMLWLLDSKTKQLKPVFPDLIRQAMYTCQHRIADFRIEQIGQVINICYESENHSKSKQEIEANLVKLFDKLGLDRAQLNFQIGVHQAMVKKLRRIRCRNKPKHTG